MCCSNLPTDLIVKHYRFVFHGTFHYNNTKDIVYFSFI